MSPLNPNIVITIGDTRNMVNSIESIIQIIAIPTLGSRVFKI